MPTLQSEFIEKIEKLEPIKNGDLILITVRDKYTFDQRDLWHAIQQYNKAHPELKGMNVPIIILDASTKFNKITDTLFRMFCDDCLMWGCPKEMSEIECGNCRSQNTKIFVEFPRALHVPKIE